MAALSKGAKVPIVIIGVERAFYSFAEAIRMAMKIRESDGRSGWLMVLPPVQNITAEIEERYQKHQQALVALIAA